MPALPAEAQRNQQVREAQIRLLYGNAYTGTLVTLIAAPVLAYCQWGVVHRSVVVGWSLYMVLVSVARLLLVLRFRRAPPSGRAMGRWGTAFAVGAGMAGAGWGAAGFLLNPDGRLLNQVFLVFVLGGMMLGGASLLAPRPEAFLAFLVPAGLLPAIRFLSADDEEHLAMGVLAGVFTLAILHTTWRFYRTIESSLTVRFENQGLVEDLQGAKMQTEALNQQLERRVQERTAELQLSTERLTAEIHQREQMEVELTHSAHHDFLTGLPNRKLLNDRIGQAIALAQRHRNRVAVLFLDLDGFKHVNDSLGHRLGDKLLQSAAQRLVECVRRSDTVSRQGGDEFVVLLSEVERPEDAGMAAMKLLHAMAKPHSIDEHDLHVTTSIGVSVYPDDGLDAETLIKNADTAMYQAKEHEPHNYRFFEPAMNIRAVERQSIEGSLRRALERQEFALHYQPKIDLRTGGIVGAEALLRWTHPGRGPVPPAQFIPVAEDCGLIVPIGHWVLREACRQARVWTDAGLPTTLMAVNISAMEFRNGNFLECIFAILDETGFDPRLLELELTESVLMNNAAATVSILDVLRTKGIRLAVDDFGTGYSSLSYLRKLPIDALKIDQSFVHQLTTTSNDQTIVTAMIHMGRSLGLRVVAEGVETQAELAFLQAHQCDEAQGYFFSRPLGPEQFGKLLQGGMAA